MSTSERGGLKAAFSGFGKVEADKEAELKLLGRRADAGVSEAGATEVAESYQVATAQIHSGAQPATSRLIPRPLLHREPVRQLSFRCPVSIAAELRRKAAFNQLEQQEIIVEGIRRVLAGLEDPPSGWEG
jgi:hypothetical protein